MIINFCEFCKYHEVFIDVIDHQYYHDGCQCVLNKPDSDNLHGNNCTQYVDPDFREGCPYFKLRGGII